jgi:uncharacterized coiled-coil protein SlyX
VIFASSVTGDPQSWLPAVIGLVVAILGGGGIAALIRAKPEGSKILIDAAAGVVVVQTGVISDLRSQLTETQEQLEEAQKQINKLRTDHLEMNILRHENSQLNTRIAEQELEIQGLRSRVAELEHQRRNQ